MCDQNNTSRLYRLRSSIQCNISEYNGFVSYHECSWRKMSTLLHHWQPFCPRFMRSWNSSIFSNCSLTRLLFLGGQLSTTASESRTYLKLKTKHDERLHWNHIYHQYLAFQCICYLKKDTTLTPDTGNFHIGVNDWQHQNYIKCWNICNPCHT